MGNRPASPAGVRGSGGNPKPSPGIVEGWRVVASFVVVLFTFAVFIWLMYEVVINDNDNAYCKVRPFFLPLCLLSFSILGVFIGGWAEASWNPPKNSPFGMLATKAGGGAAFFLIAAGVLWILSSRDDCPQSLAYTFSFEKPLEVPIEPDRDNARWYQYYPHNADVTHGKLFYATGEDATDLDPFQDLRFKLGLGKTGSVLCPISVRIYNRRKPFKGVCHDSGPASLAAQAGNEAPREAADLGEPEAAEKDCFAEIRAAGQPVNRPYNQTFTRDGRNLRLGPHVTIHLYKGDICIENGSGKIVFPASSASLSPPTFSWFRPLDYVVSSARAASSESCGEAGPLESPPPSSSCSSRLPPKNLTRLLRHSLPIFAPTNARYTMRCLGQSSAQTSFPGYSGSSRWRRSVGAMIASLPMTHFPICARMTRPSWSSISSLKNSSSATTTRCGAKRASC